MSKTRVSFKRVCPGLYVNHERGMWIKRSLTHRGSKPWTLEWDGAFGMIVEHYESLSQARKAAQSNAT